MDDFVVLLDIFIISYTPSSITTGHRPPISSRACKKFSMPTVELYLINPTFSWNHVQSGIDSTHVLKQYHVQ